MIEEQHAAPFFTQLSEPWFRFYLTTVAGFGSSMRFASTEP
jgi:hypothetical protein